MDVNEVYVTHGTITEKEVNGVMEIEIDDAYETQCRSRRE